MRRLLAAVAVAISLSGCTMYTAAANGADGQLYVFGMHPILGIFQVPFAKRCTEGEYPDRLSCRDLPMEDADSGAGSVHKYRAPSDADKKLGENCLGSTQCAPGLRCKKTMTSATCEKE